MKTKPKSKKSARARKTELHKFKLGPGDLELLHDCVESAFWPLSNWFHEPGESGALTMQERAKALNVPYEVACAIDAKLDALGSLSNAIERAALHTDGSVVITYPLNRSK
jgi:hypothetical protein